MALGSEEDKMIMEIDSNDEAFSLSEFEGNVDELGQDVEAKLEDFEEADIESFDGMMDL